MAKAKFSNKEFSTLVTRRDYSKITKEFDAPNLLDIQKKSFAKFIDSDLESTIKSFFPINSIGKRYTLSFNGIEFDKPKRSSTQCRDEGKTYGKSLYVNLELTDNESGEVKKVKRNKNSKSNGIFFCDIPIMTDKGTFIVNGIEKIVISQIVRSPGAYMFSKAQIKLSNSRKRTQEGYICEVLPSKGTLFLVFIGKNKKYVQIMFRNSSGDSTSILPITSFLKALGLSVDEILNIFDNNSYIKESLLKEDYSRAKIMNDHNIMTMLKNVTKDTVSDDKARTIDFKLKKLIYNYKAFVAENDKLIKAKNEKTIAEMNDILDKIICEKASKDLVELLSISTRQQDSKLRVSKDDDICFQALVYKYFFDNKFYDLSSAGRYKMTRKLRLSERLYKRVLAENIIDNHGKVVVSKGVVIEKEELDLIKNLSKGASKKIQNEVAIKNRLTSKGFEYGPKYEKISVYSDNENQNETIPIIGVDNELTSKSLTMSDLISIVSYVINLSHNIGVYDDIDHIGNKRIKLIHELLRQKCQLGLVRLEKFINEKLANADGANISEEEKVRVITVKSVINAKPFQIAIKDFFNSHQLTQFIDQQNPLSELTNKRRISAMGPGGISREDPNLDIRDVHYSQYGRICPIETPEGMNIGLIMSLANFAKIDDNGFLITPYWKVKNGIITNEIEWLNALREDEYVIATSNINVVNNKFTEDKVLSRFRSSLEFFDAKKVDYVDISPKQVVSVASSCIPFLENNDANRALMGANMQRQATPLIKPHAPIVGTGNEFKIAHDSGMAIVYDHDKPGKIKYVDGKKIQVENKDGVVEYELNKFVKSNQNTCNNQTPIVDTNEKIIPNQMIADGPAISNGELALGQNVLVGFTTWRGYNYEDAIIISSRLATEDLYTSIHITEYNVECLRTKNGDEEIVRDIPNVSESSKKLLDFDGVIMVGAEVKEGDILVGKISPKGQVDFTSEEKLLQAIFGQKTKNAKETSLKVPHGGEGTVAMVRRFKVEDGYELGDDVIEQVKVYVVQKRKIQIGDKMAGRHGNKGIISKIVPMEDMPHLEDGTPLDIMLNPLGVPSRMNIGQILEMHLGLAMKNLSLQKLLEYVFEDKTPLEFKKLFGINEYNAKNLKKNIKTILHEKKITKLEVAKTQFSEIDLSIALMLTGISRDDILYKIATPVFEGVDKKDLEEIMKEAGIDPLTSKDGEGKDGKFKLIDGRTGEYFDGNISVGVIYMLKLDHMVDDKLHARSVGSYSKITQQPLGGKSQNGGQRFGEMEVWALEAYGAAYNLREILTIKSDDVKGRNATYNAIIKGKEMPPYGLPESFKLLTKQLQGLGLKIDITKDDETSQEINEYITDVSLGIEEDSSLIDISDEFIRSGEI
ncbi:MAG: DNA-directed RNA polymerase subunit beta [Mycoplasmoidaceae bacterium]